MKMHPHSAKISLAMQLEAQIQAMENLSFPVSRLFPRNNYNTSVRQTLHLVPMWLIAADQPFATIKATILTCNSKNRDWRARHPRYLVTALHVAVWKNNYHVVRYLLEDQNCSANVRDRIGFLPLHYAEAMGDDNPERYYTPESITLQAKMRAQYDTCAK